MAHIRAELELWGAKLPKGSRKVFMSSAKIFGIMPFSETPKRE